MMQTYSSQNARHFPEQRIQADLLIAGGGLSGVCAALAAARDGLEVVLIQDRPVLGGNASSEVRLWANGATSHMGNNNRWAREGGIMGEIMEENLWRNKEGNPVLFDMVLLDLVQSQPGLTLLLNTVVTYIEKSDRRLKSVEAFNAINQTRYHVKASQFIDASGDGVLGYLAGAAHRVGAETIEEFGEKMAPGEHFGHKLGHSIYFYTKRTSQPVRFVPPSFALKEITAIPRYKRLTSDLNGCDLWWLEWGGRLDTVHESETIKWELWKIVWGVWDYIKNSGEFPDADTLTIEWVGLIPGKRESRRFVGDTLLCQQDIIEQRDHYDAVAYGGWSIDLHPADGVYSEHDGCRQFHSKGTYTIPFRALYSQSLDNLLLTGRLISATHVAFGSARVMCTCGVLGEVVGRAAAICHQQQLTPAQLAQPERVTQLQQHLLRAGAYIPRQQLANPVSDAEVAVSSTLQLSALPADGGWQPLQSRCALLLPLKAGERLPAITVQLRAKQTQKLQVSLLTSDNPANTCGDQHIASQTITVNDQGSYRLSFDYRADVDRYLFIAFEEKPEIEVALTRQRLPGIMMVFNSLNPRVAKRTRQINDGDYGVDEFDFWLPRRAPNQVLLAFTLETPLKLWHRDYLLNGKLRPEQHTNCWVPAQDDAQPTVTWRWEQAHQASHITLLFDNDFDHAMETVQMGHAQAVTPHCTTHYRLWLDEMLLVEVKDNHHSLCHHAVPQGVSFRQIRLELIASAGALPALYGLHLHQKAAMP
ncbi:FAD-dependent oxidoreductase [Pantoea rwandensis]|nr:MULTISPECIES: FAD-dependent oxidoreductase [unclassified Pantoea]MCA1178208.1 FAD-dependent oxidoreductase [Pantoea sp. alder69]MCA1252223.1 FAD-dependent oxidoreductase [Pantoea sp. alder70]MCA1266696.1 FAD-dependent oxidoreductase [Pantoea sp. alder81]